MKNTNWQLFVDESGDFDRPDDTVCVAGLLLPVPDAEELVPLLRARVVDAHPLVEYPPHASVLNLPVMWAMHALRADPEAKAGARADLGLELTGAATKALKEAPEPWAGFLQSWLLWEKVEHSDLKELDAWLRATQTEAYASLANLAEQSEQAVHDDILTPLLELGGELEGGLAPVAFVAAEETAPQGVVPTSAGDRYLDLLELVFERVYALLREPGGARHHVVVRVCERDLRFNDPARNHRLNDKDLTEVSRRAARFPLLRPQSLPDPRAWLTLLPVERFDGKVHPGLVLADRLANRARQQLSKARYAGQGAAASLEVLQRTLEARVPAVATGLSPRASRRVGALPTLMGNGVARERVRQAFEGDSKNPGALRPTWALQSTQAWQRATFALLRDAEET